MCSLGSEPNSRGYQSREGNKSGTHWNWKRRLEDCMVDRLQELLARAKSVLLQQEAACQMRIGAAAKAAPADK